MSALTNHGRAQSDPGRRHARLGARARAELVRQLKAEPGRDIWLCGGGRLAGGVFTEIDELILKVNPLLIGSGVPLFAGAVGTQRATLVERQSYPNGFVLARYDLARAPHRLTRRS